MNRTSPETMVVFSLYIAGVFALAILAGRVLSKKSFLSEYFLGSRGLGASALAFTFAATSASGGSFGGYPSLIYSHGWVIALWIAGYMVFPLTTMGVMGKRLNQVARKSDAITIADVLRDRYQSPEMGVFASLTIIFFTTCVLVAQFKLGALIIEDTFNLNFAGSYRVSLLLFSVIVICYTAYGGFRAVVWTDVMQGVVMGLGVIILVPIVLWKTGGLQKAGEMLRDSPQVTAVTSFDGAYDDLVYRASPELANVVYKLPEERNATLDVATVPEGNRYDLVVRLATNDEGASTTTPNDIIEFVANDERLSQIIEIQIPYRNDRTVTVSGETTSHGADGRIMLAKDVNEKRFAFLKGDELLFGPGRTNTGKPYHALGMCISFFFIWSIVGIAQPGNMVRLMAFKDSRTLKRAMITVTIYFALIYLPLVFIVMAARTVLPPLTPENSDRTMVLVATRLVADMGLGYRVLGAIFIAAPFAAVMSTVDSFLLLISSGAVRDIYQRTINPKVSERTIKIASVVATAAVGILVTVVAMFNPPRFLQMVVVFVSGGFATTLLAPMILGLYWPRVTRAGGFSAMVGGFVACLALFSPQWVGGSRIDFLGLHPAIWGMAVSFALGIGVSLIGRKPSQELVDKYFG